MLFSSQHSVNTDLDTGVTDNNSGCLNYTPDIISKFSIQMIVARTFTLKRFGWQVLFQAR